MKSQIYLLLIALLNGILIFPKAATTDNKPIILSPELFKDVPHTYIHLILLAAISGTGSAETVEQLLPIGVTQTLSEFIFPRSLSSLDRILKATLKSENPNAKEILSMFLRTGWIKCNYKYTQQLSIPEQVALLKQSNPANLTGETLKALIEAKVIEDSVAVNHAAQRVDIEILKVLFDYSPNERSWSRVDLQAAIALVATSNSPKRMECLQFLCSEGYKTKNGKSYHALAWNVRAAISAMVESKQTLEYHDIALITALTKAIIYPAPYYDKDELEPGKLHLYQIGWILDQAHKADNRIMAEQLLIEGAGITPEQIAQEHQKNAWSYNNYDTIRHNHETEHRIADIFNDRNAFND